MSPDLPQGSTDERWAPSYPGLFRPHPHTWAGVKRDYTLQLTLDRPSDDLVVNARLIAVDDGQIVVCTTAEGWRTLPGGSRERDEAIERTAARELIEEAGCVLTAPVRWFAGFLVTTHAARWRDWHPYPVSAWLVGVVPVRRIGPPTNPVGGETVVEVTALPTAEAIDYLAGFDNGGQDQLVALASDLGLIPSPAVASQPPRASP